MQWITLFWFFTGEIDSSTFRAYTKHGGQHDVQATTELVMRLRKVPHMLLRIDDQHVPTKSTLKNFLQHETVHDQVVELKICPVPDQKLCNFRDYIDKRHFYFVKVHVYDPEAVALEIERCRARAAAAVGLDDHSDNSPKQLQLQRHRQQKKEDGVARLSTRVPFAYSSVIKADPRQPDPQQHHQKQPAASVIVPASAAAPKKLLKDSFVTHAKSKLYFPKRRSATKRK
jgi:hypothetical protein